MTKEKTLEAMLTITVGMLVLYLIFGVKILQTIGVVVGIIGVLSPTLSKHIAWAWFKIAEGLGYVNSRILLTLIFFLFLVPIAWISRFFTKDNLQLKQKTDTYYTKRNHTYSPKDMENVW